MWPVPLAVDPSWPTTVNSYVGGTPLTVPPQSHPILQVRSCDEVEPFHRVWPPSAWNDVPPVICMQLPDAVEKSASPFAGVMTSVTNAAIAAEIISRTVPPCLRLGGHSMPLGSNRQLPKLSEIVSTSPTRRDLRLDDARSTIAERESSVASQSHHWGFSKFRISREDHSSMPERMRSVWRATPRSAMAWICETCAWRRSRSAVITSSCVAAPAS